MVAFPITLFGHGHIWTKSRNECLLTKIIKEEQNNSSLKIVRQKLESYIWVTTTFLPNKVSSPRHHVFEMETKAIRKLFWKIQCIVNPFTLDNDHLIPMCLFNSLDLVQCNVSREQWAWLHDSFSDPLTSHFTMTGQCQVRRQAAENLQSRVENVEMG